MSLTNMHDPALERGRLCVVITTIVINVIAVLLLTFVPWSDWRTGAALNVVDNCLLIGFAVVRRDALLARFLLFGAVVGITANLALLWCSHCWRESFGAIRGASPLLPASLA
jgi:hypothetical protein